MAAVLARQRLRDAPGAAGPFLAASRANVALPGLDRAGAGKPAVSTSHTAAVLARAAHVAPADWHGPFPANAPPWPADLFGPGDVRPVWERNRWAELPLLAQAAILDFGGGHRARAETFMADWSAANPPFHGPNWACGQESALRVLHLGLALGLLGLARNPPEGARAMLVLHARRIAATPAYALAQDNNHPISEAAGLFACGLLLRHAALARQGDARLTAAVRRLVAPCGAFAQLSTGYHRLLLDVLALAEWLRRHLDGPPFDPVARERAAAATLWLHRLTDPATGATPRLGQQDGSAFADLSLAGSADARPSVERAAWLFAGKGGGSHDDPGCAWLGLGAAATPVLPRPSSRWASEGLMGWHQGGTSAFLRTGPLRFRPGQADLLHLDLWDGPIALLRDGGTGAYNPAPADRQRTVLLAGTAGHNTVEFDGEDQMPRVSRFLFAHWPRTGRLSDGAWVQDHRGRRHERRVAVEGRRWTVEDRLAGRFATVALRWRLAPAAWSATGSGASSALGRIGIAGDAPLACTVEEGWESPAYGEFVRVLVLTARAKASITRIETSISLPE